MNHKKIFQKIKHTKNLILILFNLHHFPLITTIHHNIIYTNTHTDRHTFAHANIMFEIFILLKYTFQFVYPIYFNKKFPLEWRKIQHTTYTTSHTFNIFDTYESN